MHQFQRKTYLALLFEMKRIVHHTVFWLSLCCLSAANLKPLVYPDAMAVPQQVVIDAHNDSLPTESKEEKTEWFKNIAAPLVQPTTAEARLDARQYMGYLHVAIKQVFLPIILPPPKQAA